MNPKKIPVIIMLVGALAACITAKINNYSLYQMLILLLVTLIVFLILGFIAVNIFKSFNIIEKNEEKDAEVDDEGEVVEKQLQDENVKDDALEMNLDANKK